MHVARPYASLFAALAIIALMLPFTAAPAAADSAASVPTNFRDELVWGGLDQPTGAVFANNGRAFVIQKDGRISSFDSVDDTSATQIGDLSAEVDDYWDRGLLGLAIDPGFLTGRPYLYVLYTYDRKIGGGPTPLWNDACPNPPGPTTDGCPVSARLSKLTVSGNGAGNSVTEAPLITDWCQQFPSHSIGTVRFGPEGALYVSGGDGASFTQADFGQLGGTLPDTTNPVTPVNPCGDPADEGGGLRSQDIRSNGDAAGLDGTIIRVDPDTGAAWPDNANAGNSDANKARVIAYGLRNPFRFTFRSNGDVWVGDVGYSTWEEIDEITNPDAAPKNFGWPCFEGNATLPAYQNLSLPLCNSLASDQGPAFTYNHGSNVVSGDGCTPGSSALSGITFLRSDSAYPDSYDGGMFFTDYTRKCIWFAPADGNGRPDFSQVSRFANLRRSSGTDGGSVFLGLTPDGDLLYADYDRGEMRAIRYYPPGAPPTASFTASPSNGLAPLAVHFDANSSTDNGSIVGYAWDFDGDGQFDDGSGVTINHTFAQGTYTVGLQVTDDDGQTDTAFRTVSSGNGAPSVSITAPATSLTWVVGQSITFAATATDVQDGTLPASAYEWTLAIEHCPSNCHEHQIQTFDGVTSGTFAAPDHDFPSWLRLYLTVTDSDGLSTTVQREIHPKTGTVSVKSTMSAVPLGLGDGNGKPPPTVTNIVGHPVQLSAPTSIVIGGLTYKFDRWSDGKAALHTVKTTATAQKLTATYHVSSHLPYTDISTSKFVANIVWLHDQGITSGCSATKFCPTDSVSRAQMATFLARALHLAAASKDYFTDDDSNSHEGDINKLAKAGITVGCSATKFCPTDLVSRAQMATFLTKAFHLPAATRDYFTDDESNSHEGDINRLAKSGITAGCTATTFCPTGIVSRGQMAAFLDRAMTP